MSITISSDGFDGTISSSNGDIFIKTQNNSGSISIGTQLELTGSKVIEKDFDGNIRQVKVYNVDGSIGKTKFDKSTGKVIEEKFKDIALGKEFKRSGSNSTTAGSTDNQIEFQQNSAGAFISVSGSNPGFNVINSDRKTYRIIRETYDQFIDTAADPPNLWRNGIAQTNITSNGTNIKSGSFVFSAQVGLGNAILILSESGDVRIPGKLYAQEYHTEMVSSSVIYSSGSTQFGNSHDDTHTFTGAFVNAITASGNISASGEIYGKQTHFMHHAYLEDSDHGENFIPMSGTLTEISNTQYYNKMIAPYDGEIKKVWINAENDPGQTTVKFYKNGSEVAKQVITDGNIDTDSVVFSIFNTGPSIGTGADRTFSAGDVLQISINPANAIGEVQVTSVWEYNIIS